jgi:hypothetical protein
MPINATVAGTVAYFKSRYEVNGQVEAQAALPQVPIRWEAGRAKKPI